MKKKLILLFVLLLVLVMSACRKRCTHCGEDLLSWISYKNPDKVVYLKSNGDTISYHPPYIQQSSDDYDASQDGTQPCHSYAELAIREIAVGIPYDIILDASTGESDPLFTWEIINTAFEKDILELGDRKFNSNLSADTVAAIEAKLKNPTEGQPYTPADANSGVAAVNAIVAYTLKSIGVHGRQASLQTIRKTMIIGNQFKSNTPTLMSPGFDYKLFTTPQWRTQYNNDTNVLNQMPTLMYDSLLQSLTVASYIPRSNPPSSILQPTIGWNMDQKGIVTFIGWLQFPAEYQMVSNNKVQITQNWTFNQWSAGDWGLYDPAIPIGTPPNPNDVLHIPTPHP